MSLTCAFQGVAILFLAAFQGLMGQNVYFNETCDPVDLTYCNQYYPDPCSCTSFFQCAQNQHKMYHRPCAPGTIYDPNVLVCVHPKDTKCDTLRPWERCNVTDTRKKQLSFMCSTRTSSSSSTTTTTTTTTSTVPNPNGISPQTLMQIITPTIVGVLGVAMLIALVVYRLKTSSAIHETIPKQLEWLSDTHETIPKQLEWEPKIPFESLWTTERLSDTHETIPKQLEWEPTVPFGSLSTIESGLSDPYMLDLQSYRSSPEYCPGERQTINPACDDILPYSSTYESIPNSTTSSDPRMYSNTTRHLPTMDIAGHTRATQRKTQYEETSSSGTSSYEAFVISSHTSQQSETDQDEETSSSGTSSYEEVLKSSQTSQRSETDPASTYCYSISSNDSGYIVFTWLHHNNNRNRPWPNKPVLNIKDVYLPRLDERTELNYQVP